MSNIDYAFERSKCRTRGPVDVREAVTIKINRRDDDGNEVNTAPIRGRVLYENGEPIGVIFDDPIMLPKQVVSTPALVADSLNVSLSSHKLNVEVA